MPAPAWAVVPYPEQLDPHAVVALVLDYLTAWQMLRAAGAADGSTILVHSAAGGVGSALLQLAALRDQKVIGTASAGKAELVEHLGATRVDYRTQDVAAAVRRAAPEGIDVVSDGLGSASWRRDLPLLRPGGRLIIYGMSTAFTRGRRSVPELLHNLVRLPRTSYLTYLTRAIGVVAHDSGLMVATHHHTFRQDLQALIALLDAGRIAPVNHGTYPLEQAARAQDELGGERTTGKMTLAPDLDATPTDTTQAALPAAAR